MEIICHSEISIIVRRPHMYSVFNVCFVTQIEIAALAESLVVGLFTIVPATRRNAEQ
jgi:hypothetical protein